MLEEYTSEFEGRGMQYQALAAEAYIAAGRTDSDVLPIDETVAIMATLDDRALAHRRPLPRRGLTCPTSRTSASRSTSTSTTSSCPGTTACTAATPTRATVSGSPRTPREPEIAERLDAATIDVGAIIDYAASFGTLVLTRAYADWSAPVNAVYRSQLVARAIDLVQLFPAAAYAKNGADIRLAVDAVEDMFRLPDLTHVVIVAGDSDYVPLAQRCKRLGRFVVGVGVAGSTAKSLAAACDQFDAYDALPGVAPPDGGAEEGCRGLALSRTRKAAADPSADLLERALRLESDKEDADWQHASAVKALIKRTRSVVQREGARAQELLGLREGAPRGGRGGRVGQHRAHPAGGYPPSPTS